eukprot:scaffold43930_cov27-Tisochrysis_lutea.AAC.2
MLLTTDARGHRGEFDLARREPPFGVLARTDVNRVAYQSRLGDLAFIVQLKLLGKHGVKDHLTGARVLESIRMMEREEGVQLNGHWLRAAAFIAREEVSNSWLRHIEFDHRHNCALARNPL